MQKIHIHLNEIKLIGMQVRTNNRIELAKTDAKIGPCVQNYFHNALFEQIPDRASPGKTYCTFTDYESDHTGDYTYFIGEEVSNLENIPANFSSLIIPPQDYVKFTAGPGPMPDVVINAWQQIWKMSPADFGGTRAYKTDFELYDERAADHSKAVLNIYIGIHRTQ